MDRKRLSTDFYHFFALMINLTDPAAEPHFAKKLAICQLSSVMVRATNAHADMPIWHLHTPRG